MKSTVKGAILITILFTLISCSVNKPGTPTTQIPVPTQQIQPTINPTQTKGSKQLICIIVPYGENPYFGTMQEIGAAKVEELGYEALKLAHDDDANKQEDQIDTCIAQNAVAIILNNASADESVAAIQKAKDAGIPSFLIDREISQEGVAVAQIGFDHYQGATLAAQEFARLMDGEGPYIELNGRETDTNAQVRSQAYHAVLDKLPEMKMVAQHTQEWSAIEAFDGLESLLQIHPNVKGVISASDAMALGAQAALDAAGRSDVIVVSMDGSDDVNQSILSGKIDAGVLLPVDELATQAAIQADRYIRTGSTGLPEKQSMEMILLTPENACRYSSFASNGSTTSCTAIASGEKKLICVITPSQGILQETAAAKAKELGYDTIQLVYWYADEQRAWIEKCRAQNAAAIILEPGGYTTAETLQPATDAGLPVFLAGGESMFEVAAAAQIVPDDRQGATLLAKHFAELMDGEGKYIELTGDETDPVMQLRSDAYHSILDGFPQMEMVAQHVIGDALSAEDREVVETLFEMHPDIKGVIAASDWMAGIASEETISSGRSNVIVVGFGGDDYAIESIAQGNLHATMMPPMAEIAGQAAIQADLYLRTGSTGQPEKQLIAMVLLMPENACQYTAFAPNGKTSCP